MTPRPPIPEIPACWEWDPTPPDVDTEIDRLAAMMTAVAGPLADWERDYLANSRDGRVLDKWQAGRCAVCAWRTGDLVDDHDHQTGLRRGWLCSRCNGAEPGPLRVFALYRWRHPTTLLGLTLRYIDPITRRPDYGHGPPPPSGPDDGWVDNVLVGIGL